MCRPATMCAAVGDGCQAARLGYPPPDHYPVAECLRTVLSEEWEHRRYAERDLDVLTSGRFRT